jgi:hypothetical protein
MFITLSCIVGLMGIAYAEELNRVEAIRISKDVSDQFVAAFKNKQADEMVALFDDNGWRITDMGPVVGRDDLTKHFELGFKIADLESSYLDQIEVLDNNNILAAGHWEATLRLPNQPPLSESEYSKLANKKIILGRLRWRAIMSKCVALLPRTNNNWFPG